MIKRTETALAQPYHCRQQGFTEITKVDTETRKGKPARLDGQFCTNSKFRVFDEIVCTK